MNRLNIQTKNTGDTLEAQEFNSLVNKVNELVDSENNGGTPVVIDPTGILSTSSKGNVTLGSVKNVNIEPAWDNNVQNYSGNYGDIAFKPGDDIQFCSHHREPKKRDKIVVKSIDGADNPVKMQIVAGELDLAVGTTSNPKTATRKKDKNTGADTQEALFKADDAKVLDVRILTGNTLDKDTNDEREERGYLKVRAQAIDLRCEKHGGIALQPKGYDSDGNMNKIKFEHGGGDGLEFGTFNSEKTSIFTNEYRFNKNGVWKMAVRDTEASGKDIIDERENGLQGLTATGAYKYKKNNSANNSAKATAELKTFEPADDFYDFIDTADAQTTTEAIIKTSAALNNQFIETSLSSKGNLKISSSSNYKIIVYDGVPTGNELTFTIDKTGIFTKDDLKLILSGSTKLSEYIDTKQPFLIDGDNGIYRLSGNITPKVSIESEEEVDIDAKYGDVVLTSGDTVKIEAPEIRLNAINNDKSGGTVNFGATQDVIFLTNKLTKSLNVEASANPTSIKIQLQNNYQESVYWDTTEQVFRIPLKKLYLDDSHVNELTPSNYANGLAVYFEDGTRVPADYTCYMGYTTESDGVYTTNIYKTGTKGSENVLKKKLGEAVAQYTSSSASSLGTPVFNNATNIKFELPGYVAGAGVNTVGPEEFVTINSVELSDIITLVNYFKTGGGISNGPWAV